MHPAMPMQSINANGRRNGMARLVITNYKDQMRKDRAFWRKQTPEARLDAVEQLRLEAGKFLHEYPTRFRRILTVIRRTQRG